MAILKFSITWQGGCWRMLIMTFADPWRLDCWGRKPWEKELGIALQSHFRLRPLDLLRSCWCHFWIRHDSPSRHARAAAAPQVLWALQISPSEPHHCGTTIPQRYPKIAPFLLLSLLSNMPSTSRGHRPQMTTEPVTNMALAESARSFLISDTLGPAPCRTSERWHKWPATPLTCMGWALGHYLSSFLADFHRGCQHIIQKLQSKTAVNPSHHWSSTEEEQKVKLVLRQVVTVYIICQ